MNDFNASDLTPEGQRRRDAILHNVLTAAAGRQRRKRAVRWTAAACTLAALGAGIPYWLHLHREQQIAEQRPRSIPGEIQPSPLHPQPSAEHASLDLMVEPLSDEMLLAQLEAARLPYLQTADGEVRLISTGYDPWLMEVDQQ